MNDRTALAPSRHPRRHPRRAPGRALAVGLATVLTAAAPVRAEAPAVPAGVPPALWERLLPLLEAGAGSGQPAYAEAGSFTGSDAGVGASFGFSLAIDGDTAVIGAILQTPGSTGAAYVFQRDLAGPGLWGEVAKLTPSDAAPGDQAGFAVAIAGDTVAVGAPHDDDGGDQSGSVYLFERNAGGTGAWGEVAKLTASDAAADDLFGSAVAIAGDTVAVGAPQDDDAGISSGSVYHFERDAGGPGAWGEAAKLAAFDAAISSRFGSAVAIAGDRLAVGAPNHIHVHNGTFSLGAVYLFERNAGGAESWSEVLEVTAPPSTPQVTMGSFGAAVDLSGDRMAIGAPLNQANNAGSVFVHERDAGGPGAWGEVARITLAAEGLGRDRFGRSVAIAGDLLAVGRETIAYLYERNAGGSGGWGEVGALDAANLTPEHRLGAAVGIAGELVFVGAPGGGPTFVDPGSVYLFAPAADLAVLVDDGVGSVAPGGTTTYAVAVVNAGPNAVSGAAVEDLFPSSLACTWSCSAGSGAVCTPGPVAGDLVDPAELPVGGFAIYLAACAVDPGASGSLVNTATVAAPANRPDFDAANNVAVDVDTLAPAADLALAIAASADPVPPDGELTYTLTAANLGPSTAAGVVVSTALPPGVGLVSTTGCAEDPAGVPACTLGDVGPGTPAAVVLRVQVASHAPPVLNVSATVASSTLDPDPTNNGAVESTVHDLEAPSVSVARAVSDPDTGDSVLVPCTTVLAAPLAVDLTFSEPMFDPPGDGDPEDVTHSLNYLLVTPGPDRAFQTAGCGGGPQGDDVAVEIAGVTYDGATATARLALAAPAPSVLHRLYVCDALRDLPGNALDGDGDGGPGGELALPFRVDDGNLFAGGHFDCDLGGWLATDPSAIGHRPDRDFEASLESGAAAIAGDAFALGRCLPLAGGRAYAVTARAHLVAADDGFTLAADCRFYPGSSCLGPGSPGPSEEIALDQLGVWVSLAGAFDAPAGTVSALCVFTLAGGAFELFVDGLELRDRTLFGDGFESGDTSAWDSVVE